MSLCWLISHLFLPFTTAASVLKRQKGPQNDKALKTIYLLTVSIKERDS